MPTLSKTLLFFLFIGAAFFACDKECADPYDPKCPNFDPCLTYNTHHAECRIVDSVENSDAFKDMNRGFDIDTTWTFREIWFKAQHHADSFEWRVGTDARVWRTKEFPLEFDVTGPITVRLVTFKKSDKECFPESDGRDTFYKTFHLVIPSSEAPIYGTYKGHNTDTPNEEFEFKVGSPFDGNWADAGIRGLPNGCTSPVASTCISGFDYFVLVEDAINCFAPKGVGILQEDKQTIVVDYSYISNVNTNERVTKKFVGKKKL